MPTDFYRLFHLDMKLTQLSIYPIKSLGGIRLEASEIELRGLRHDRRWMLVDDENRFMTQREIPAMALFRLEIRPPFLEIFQKDRPAVRLKIPLEPDWRSLPSARVTVFSWQGMARICGPEAADFFSEKLGKKLRLAFMPDATRRQADRSYAAKGQFVSFADGYSFLVIGQKSLDELNRRLTEKGSPALPMERFRPNFVFDGAEAAPFMEDGWADFRIGDARFRGVKNCGRCVMTTIDQQTAERGKEPLRTLADFRFANNKILFGQNLLWTGGGRRVKLGDEIAVETSMRPLIQL